MPLFREPAPKKSSTTATCSQQGERAKPCPQLSATDSYSRTPPVHVRARQILQPGGKNRRKRSLFLIEPEVSRRGGALRSREGTAGGHVGGFHLPAAIMGSMLGINEKADVILYGRPGGKPRSFHTPKDCFWKWEAKRNVLSLPFVRASRLSLMPCLAEPNDWLTLGSDTAEGRRKRQKKQISILNWMFGESNCSLESGMKKTNKKEIS